MNPSRNWRRTVSGGLRENGSSSASGMGRSPSCPEKDRREATGSDGDPERGQGRMIPRMRLDVRGLVPDSGKFLRIAESTDSGLLLASFLPLDANIVLGTLLDPLALARGLFPAESGKPAPEEGLSVVIVDESGKFVVGPGLGLSKTPRKPGFSAPLHGRTSPILFRLGRSTSTGVASAPWRDSSG